ncbi:DUF692 domain-containing protein [uncultured Aquabacterium sp.]|uniref:DUF692 domain-containing protein n=1 Tax=Aquabacterium sp. TaxID=1872578 RepID=UPI0025E2EAE7|nr:DUF692 domain-containing protein [uncultured Aquabacterium sp.]
MTGLGWRREMADWDRHAVQADFFEVVPENWLRRDRAPLHALRATGRPVHLHGVSLNLGGQSPIDTPFLRDVGRLMDELGTPHYSDHLAASGDAHQLYDLFPIPFTADEVVRVADRIRAAQDVLGRRIAVENTTWYTNIGPIPEPDFLAAVAERADCQVLLDLNNIVVNHKNHGGLALDAFVQRVDLRRVSYLHVAGHEFDARFGLHIDTHSQPVEPGTRAMAQRLQAEAGLPVLLEWDNDVPSLDVINQELAWLRSTTT